MRESSPISKTEAKDSIESARKLIEGISEIVKERREDLLIKTKKK